MLVTWVLTVPFTVWPWLRYSLPSVFLTYEVMIIELSVEECVDQGVGRCGKCSAQDPHPRPRCLTLWGHWVKGHSFLLYNLSFVHTFRYSVSITTKSYAPA